MTLSEQLRDAARQLREDAADCWGIRRKSAANIMEQAAKEIEQKKAA